MKFHSHREVPVGRCHNKKVNSHNHKEAQGSFTIIERGPKQFHIHIEAPGSVIERPKAVSHTY